MRLNPKPRVVTLLLALMLSLLLAACGQVAAKPRATAAPTLPPLPTSTTTLSPLPTVTVIPSGGDPVQGQAASWSHANLPAGFGMAFHESDLQVAASDGQIAYSCAVPGSQSQTGTAHVVVTHNGGASWTYVANMPESWSSCAALVVDMLDPSVVIAQGDFLGPQVVTFDGGGSWQTLSLPSQQAIMQLATRGSHAYALMQIPQDGGSSSSEILAESSDHLHTWREIDGSLSSANLRGFWINPGTGALLLRTYDTGLWTSTDDGATWSQMRVPETNIVDYFVQQPVASQPWRLCAEYYASQDDANGSLVCTMDGGHSWFAPPPSPFWQAAGIASDGAILVYNQQYTVYRLPSGARQWQNLGAAPQAGCCIQYFPSSGDGLLWMFTAESDGAGAPPDPRAIFSAIYPY